VTGTAADERPERPERPVRRRRSRGLTPEGATRASAHVCEAASCLSARSDQVLDGLVEQVTERGLTDVAVKRVGCLGLCAAGPLVEVKGSGKLLPACVTGVEEGMEVVAHSERLAAYRRTIVEMLFVERNHICSVCVANNHCELQDLAAALGVTHFDLPAVNPRVGVDASHPLFAIDHNRCVMCTRCVRVCDEIEGAHTWDVMGRGIDARVVTDLGTPWGESSTCTSCGKCVQVCPTGALFEKGRAVGEGTRTQRPFLPYLKRPGEAWEP